MGIPKLYLNSLPIDRAENGALAEVRMEVSAAYGRTSESRRSGVRCLGGFSPVAAKVTHGPEKRTRPLTMGIATLSMGAIRACLIWPFIEAPRQLLDYLFGIQAMRLSIKADPAILQPQRPAEAPVLNPVHRNAIYVLSRPYRLPAEISVVRTGGFIFPVDATPSPPGVRHVG